MNKYVVSEPRGPFQSVVTGTGEVVALQIPAGKWADRIARGLAMLDVAEAAHIKKVDALSKLILFAQEQERRISEEGGDAM